MSAGDHSHRGRSVRLHTADRYGVHLRHPPSSGTAPRWRHPGALPAVSVSSSPTSAAQFPSSRTARALPPPTPLPELWPSSAPRPSVLDVARHLDNFFYDTAVSLAPAAMRSVIAVSRVERVVFGSDWSFSAMTFTAAGDLQPELSETFEVGGRIRIERENALQEFPGWHRRSRHSDTPPLSKRSRAPFVARHQSG